MKWYQVCKLPDACLVNTDKIDILPTAVTLQIIHCYKFQEAIMPRVFAIILAGMMFFSMPSFAQEKEPTDDQIEQFSRQLNDIRQRLNLTEEQEQAIKPIVKERAEQQRDLLKTYGFEKGKSKPELSFSQKRSLGKKMKAIKKDSNNKVSKVLSDEQMKEYKKIQKENRARFKERLNKK